MNKIPYNLFKNNKGKWIPKAPVIRNSPEVKEWIKNNHKITFDKPNEEGEWICIGIGASYIGNLFPFAYIETNEFYSRYTEDNPYCKIFDYDFEGFKKYLNWAINLPHKIVNGKFE